jgi:hypothetical protein
VACQTDELCGRAATVAANKAGIADVLLLKDLDRAIRDAYDGLALQREPKAEGSRIVTARGEACAASESWDAHTHTEGTAVTSIGGPSTSRVTGPY